MSRIQKIHIDQQMAELGINVTPAQLKINNPRMKMRISSEAPQMEIVRKAPSFRINRKKHNPQMAHAPSQALTRIPRSAAKHGAAIKGIKPPGEDGSQSDTAKILGEKTGKLVRSKNASAIMRRKEPGLDKLSKNMPDITWEKGQMSINWSKHSLVIDWDGDYMPQLTIDPKYSIEIFMRTEPYFRITVEELTDPGIPGQFVDQAI